MTYAADKVAAGGRRIDVIQLVLDACSLTFGVGLCYATGEPCKNAWASCKAPDVFADTTKTITLCTPGSNLPPSLNAIPLVRANGIKFDPADPTPDDGIGKVGSVDVDFFDAPHDDVGIDPYISQRSYSGLDRSTFWPKLRANWPNYQGRTLYWYTGYEHYPFSLSNLRRRTYLMESWAGFGGKDGVKIKAKDPLKLADDKRSVWPRKTNGTLAAAMTDVAPPTTIDVHTTDPTEYDLAAYEALSCVRIGSEVFRYTGTTPITDGVRLTGVTRSAPAPYICSVSAHDAGDDVQKCAYFAAMSAANILRYLLTLGAEVPSAYIDYAAWSSLYATWLGGLTLTRLICEPQGVTSLCAEVLLQSSGWGLWWDDINEQIGYEVFRPAALSETVTPITEANSQVKATLKIIDDPDRLINNCVFYYGQVDPTKDEKDVTNYGPAINSFDIGSASAREVGSLRTKVIYGRWHPSAAAATIARIADRIVVARGSIPYRAEFKVARKDDDLQTGDFIDLTCAGITDLFGAQVTTRMRVIKGDFGQDEVTYTAREDFVSMRYGLIAPAALRGVTWATATAAQRATYVFISDANGLMSDGSIGKRIY